MSLLMQHLRGSMAHPAFWSYSTWLSVITRYRRSFIGPLWMLVPPAMYIFGLGFFFGRVSNHEPGHFMTHLGIGIVVFRLVTTVVNDSASVMINHSAYILDGNSRLTDYMLRVLLTSLIHFSVGMPLALAVAWGAGVLDPSGLLPAAAGLLWVLFTLVWVSGVVALIGARYPDIHEFMGSLTMLLFITTPILFYAGNSPRGTWQGVMMRFNPVFHMV
jgi:ABC-2 type transport system permease protein